MLATSCLLLLLLLYFHVLHFITHPLFHLNTGQEEV